MPGVCVAVNSCALIKVSKQHHSRQRLRLPASTNIYPALLTYHTAGQSIVHVKSNRVAALQRLLKPDTALHPKMALHALFG